jgi:trehalose-6-phosphate synthase
LLVSKFAFKINLYRYMSEFAGAAQSLGAGALLVNPWNVNDMVGL